LGRRILLDTGPLGRVAHPRITDETRIWVDSLLARDFEILIPEIADYELRRSFVFRRLSDSLAELDALRHRFTYLPINERVMRRAASLWAEARWRGRPTADPKELDADVILASQAIEASATIATDNVGHLSQFVLAVHWRKVAAR
jgi:predicted nucleic acid-binding protein